MADKSAYIQLYDNEEKKDAYKWQIENKQAGVSIKDSKAGRPMKFFADSFKFYAGGATPGPGYDLKTELDAADTSAAAAQSKADANESGIAAETVRAQASEATNSANLSAEIVSRAAAVAAVQTEVDAEEVKRGQEDVVLDNKIDAEISNRASAVNVEKVRAEAAETALQLQISNILSNTDTTALNSLAELVSSF